MNKPAGKSVILLVSCLLSMGLMAVVFALCGVTPFGSHSLAFLDMSSQFISFLSSLRDILTGKASLFYLPSMALGGNMSGLLSYYLISPITLLYSLFSKENLLMAVSLVYILRVGLCSMTMTLYAGERHGWSWRTVLPGLAYGFTAYMVAYCNYYMWHDSVILLPVIALGIARLTEGRGWQVYVLSLAAALITSFYTGYMLCIFSVLFFLYELLSKPADKPGRAVVGFGLSSLAAGALAAAVLVPTAFTLMGGKGSFSLSDLSLAPKFALPALASKLFPGAFNYAELMPAGLPNIFSGTVMLALAVLYFADGHIPRRRRIGTGVLLAAIAVSFWISALDLIWHGMNVPTWNNYRYSFLFSFLVIAAADKALADIRRLRSWQFFLSPAAVALLGVLAFAGRSYDYVSWTAALDAVVTAAAACAGLWLYVHYDGKKRLAVLMAALVLMLQIGELGANAKLTIDELVGLSSEPAQWARYVEEKGEAFALVDTEGAFVRVESPDCFNQNRAEPMLFNYDGVTHYSSNAQVKNLDFLQRMGLSTYRDAIVMYGPDVTVGADSLLGIRYEVATHLNKPYMAAASAGTYSVFENPYALPLAWTADGAFGEEIKADDPFAYIQGLYAAAAPEVNEDIYTPAVTESVTTDGLTGSGDGRYTLEDGSGSLIYTLTPQADGPLYGVIDIPDYPGVMVFVNGRYMTQYAHGQNNGTLYLGRFAAGDAVTVQLTAAVDITVNSAVFVTESTDALAAYQAAMADGGCQLMKHSPTHYTGSFTTGEGDSLLVLTVANDAGWRVTLDGEPVQTLEVQDCLMAIPVTAGSHTVEMQYAPPGLIPGAAISAAAAIICAAVWVRQRKKKRNEPENRAVVEKETNL